MENTRRKALVERWPALPLMSWEETCETLHLWTQIVGKVRLELSPPLNHWWQVPFYVTARGLTTSPMPIPGEPGQIFEIHFDFLDHQLLILTSSGTAKMIPLIPRSVSAFYQEFMASLQALGINVTINTLPSEIKNPIPCDQDEVHSSYDPDAVQRFWRILVQVDRILAEFRAHFLGKSSQVHFFWGSFDLAETRFSGRRAPQREKVDRITREAYSHEVISCGFWPGDDHFAEPAFYSYTFPEPPGLKDATICPAPAFYHPKMSEFLLRYEDVRSADAPEQMLMDFFQSTYEAGATLGKWDREALER